MRNISSLAVAGAMAVAPLLTGCATAPAAMEQANNTVKLMSLMEQPLEEYRETWEAIERSRLQTLKAQRQLMTESNLANERFRLASIAAGGTKQEALKAKLLAQTDALQEVERKAGAGDAAYGQKLDALLQPIPSTTASVTAAPTAVSKMGVELSSETRTKELLAFMQEVKKGVQDGKKARDDAKAAADKTAAAIVDEAETQAITTPK